MSLCCKNPQIHVTYEYGLGWSAHCSNCYDGAPDSSNRNEVGNGKTAREAVRDWLDAVEFYQEDSREPDQDEPQDEDEDDRDPVLQKQLDRLDYENDQRKDDKLWER